MRPRWPKSKKWRIKGGTPPPWGRDMPADPISAAEAGKPAVREHADDFIESSLLAEENRRLKDELRRAEHALKVAAKVLGPYLK